MTTIPVYHQVSGQLIPANSSLPDMKFRDAWVLDSQGVVVIDPVKGAEITKRLFIEAIEAHIESVAKSKDYADSTRLATYVNSTVPSYKAEAEIFVAWRDDIWVYAYTELDKVLSGDREQPTVQEFITELPEIDW